MRKFVSFITSLFVDRLRETLKERHRMCQNSYGIPSLNSDWMWLGETLSFEMFREAEFTSDNIFPVEVPDKKFVVPNAVNSTSISIETVNHFNMVSEKVTIVTP